MLFVVVVNISNINKIASYNLFLLPGTNKADETKVYSEFSRYNVCISKFCFHFPKWSNVFSNIGIWQPGYKNNWMQWPLTVHYLPISSTAAFQAVSPQTMSLSLFYFFQSFLLKKKTAQQHHNLLSLLHIKVLLMFNFHYIPNCTLGHCLDYYRFKWKYLMTWK